MDNLNISRQETKYNGGPDYAPVIHVMRATGRVYRSQPLKEYCRAAYIDYIKVADENHGMVNAYPAEAWKNVYGIELKEIF